jgi:Protein of unknown function (DUF1580)
MDLSETTHTPPETEWLTLNQAAKYFPCDKPGKKRSLATLYRYASEGIGGVKLKTVQIGSKKCTNVHFIQEFNRQLTENSSRKTWP